MRFAVVSAVVLLSTLPAVASDASRSISAGYLYRNVPQIADGSYWKSTLVLTNLHSDRTVSFRVSFFGDNGAPKAFPIEGHGVTEAVTGTIPTGGSVKLETTGTARTLNQGWARVEATSAATDNIGTLVILSTRGVPGRPDFEATVSAALGVIASAGTFLPFDNTGGFETSFAVLNPSEITQRYFIDIFDTEGNLLKADMPFVGGQSKLVGSVAQRWPETRGKSGTIRIKGLATTYSPVSVLGFRFNAGGAFTTIPVLDPPL